MNDRPNIKPKGVPPFKKLCMTIGQLPSSYIESMSYYETLVWFIHYLRNTIIPAVDNNANALQELQGLFVQLQEYVDNYFDQNFPELVSDKLDEMASDGTLENLLNDALHLIRRYNTKSEMIENKNTLVNGMLINTYGENNINDGGGAVYEIVNEIPTGEYIDLENGLYAKYINNIMDNYYEDITTEKIRLYDTDIYITTIPLNDKYNQQINPYVAYGDGKSPTKYARDNNTSLTINASLNIKRDENVAHIPSIIGNGHIIRSYDDNSELPDCYEYVGFKADRSIKTYKVNATTAQEMLNDGIINAFDVFYPLIVDGEFVDLTTIHPTTGDEVTTDLHPRQCLGIKEDKTLIILTCDGRSSYNRGLTSEETQIILDGYDCINAWNLDGGGSTSTTIKGIKINQNYDEDGTVDRPIPYTLNFKKTIVNEEITRLYQEIGENNQNIFQILMPLYSILNVQSLDAMDCDELIGKVYLGYGNGMQNRPGTNNGWFINIPHDEPRLKPLYNKQFFIQRDNNALYQRQMVNGVFTSWELINQNICGKINVALGSGNNVIQANETYQSLTYSSIGGNTLSQQSITYDEETQSKIKINTNGYVKFSVYLAIDSATSSEKFVKMLKNGSSLNVTIMKNYIEGSKSGMLITTGLLDTDPNDYYEIQIYGKQNDSVNRGYVIVETVK